MAEKLIYNPILPIGDNEIGYLNVLTGDLVVGEREVNCTREGTKILALLIENLGSIVEHGEIIEKLWSEFEDSPRIDNRLWVNVSRVRADLNKVGLGDCLITVIDVGYKLDLEEKK